MSQVINDGGPAYPTEPIHHGYAEGTNPAGTGAGSGMSRREYFAAAAIQGMLANPNFVWDLTSDHTPEENVARRAYAVADAMLATK